MKLQNIIWPKQGVCTEEKLYFHSNMIDEEMKIIEKLILTMLIMISYMS